MKKSPEFQARESREWAARERIQTRWRRLGLRTRLMATHLALMTIVIGAIVWQSDHQLSTRLNTQFNRDLTEEGAEFSNAAKNRSAGQSLDAFSRYYLNTHLRPSSLSLIIRLPQADGGTRTMISPGLPRRFSQQVIAATLAPGKPLRRLVGLSTDEAQYRAYAAPIVLSGKPVATLVAVRNLVRLNANRNSELRIAVLEGLAALIASVLAGYLLLGRVLRVVGEVRGTAERAASGDLSLRVRYHGPDDEVGLLAHTVNTMLARIDNAFSSQRRLLSDVSHQLRTPLTVVRGHLELLAREPDADPEDRAATIAMVIDELEHLSLLAERLLLLGRALEPDFIEEEPVDVRSLLEDVFDAAQVFADRHWELDAGDESLVLIADRTKLRGALLNLLDNAVKATEEGDTIRLGVRHDDAVRFEVADTGKGLSSDEQQRLFARFARSTTRYRGSGLGLAIVKAVAEAHGGHVELDSAPGEGARFRIVLPGERVVSSEPSPKVAS